MMIERVDRRSAAQKILRIFARTVDGVDESNFDFSGFEFFADNVDIFLVTSGILDFAPAEFELAVDSAQ